MISKKHIKEIRSIKRTIGRLAAIKFTRTVLRGSSIIAVDSEFQRASHLVDMWG